MVPNDPTVSGFKVLILEIFVTFGNGPRMSLTFDTHLVSFVDLLNASPIFEIIDCNKFCKKFSLLSTQMLK